MVLCNCLPVSNEYDIMLFLFVFVFLLANILFNQFFFLKNVTTV